MAGNSSEAPLIIEAAMTPVVANTGGILLQTPDIIDEATACINAGAGVIHYHHDFALSKADSIQQCIDVQTGILARYPSTLIYPGYLPGETHEQTMEHLEPIYRSGALTMLAFDPGHATHARPDAQGEPTLSKLGGTSFSQADEMVKVSHRYGVPISLGIFEPGPLRWVRWYGANGRFTPGTIVKFYFPGDFAWGFKDVGATFGLPPSKAALDIYISLIEGSGLPWVVSFLGGAILESDMPRYILERGGHIRVGNEDPLRQTGMTNVDMIEAVVALANEVGRPVAHASEALSVLSGDTTIRQAA